MKLIKLNLLHYTLYFIYNILHYMHCTCKLMVLNVDMLFTNIDINTFKNN